MQSGEHIWKSSHWTEYYFQSIKEDLSVQLQMLIAAITEVVPEWLSPQNSPTGTACVQVRRQVPNLGLVCLCLPFFLCWSVSSAILNSERHQKPIAGKGLCSGWELTCRTKLRDTLRCLSYSDETYYSRCSKTYVHLPSTYNPKSSSKAILSSVVIHASVILLQ